jgi:hypothetical protein
MYSGGISMTLPQVGLRAAFVNIESISDEKVLDAFNAAKLAFADQASAIEEHKKQDKSWGGPSPQDSAADKFIEVLGA